MNPDDDEVTRDFRHPIAHLPHGHRSGPPAPPQTPWQNDHFGAPPQLGHHQPAPSPPSKGAGTLRWVIAGIAVVIVIAVTAFAAREYVLSNRTGDATSAQPAKAPIPPSAMDGLLMTAKQASDLYGGDPMGATSQNDDIVYTAMVPTSRATDEDCDVGVPANSDNHVDSGWKAVRSQTLASEDSDKHLREGLTQAVVGFADAQAARHYVDTAAATWRQCAGRNVNLKRGDDNSNVYWSLGEVVDTNGTIEQGRAQEGTATFNCRAAMAPRNNIVIELSVCQNDSSAPIAEMLAIITKNIEDAS